jgi:hypothetical protein
MISSIAGVINTNSYSTSFWKRDIDAIRLIGPCMHFLLSMPRFPFNFEIMDNAEDLVAREMVRLTCLMLMSRLKELFAFPASERIALQLKTTEFMSQNVNAVGKRYFDLKIWALVTVALLLHRDERGIYIQEIQREMRAVDITTPYVVVEIAREIVWIDILLSPSTDELVKDIALHVDFSQAYLVEGGHIE